MIFKCYVICFELSLSFTDKLLEGWLLVTGFAELVKYLQQYSDDSISMVAATATAAGI